MASRSGLRSAKCEGSPRLTADWASLLSARVPTCGCNPAVAATPAAFSWHFVAKQQTECRHQNPRRPPTPHVHHTAIMIPFCRATKTTLPVFARCVQNRFDSFRYLSVSTSNSWSKWLKLVVSPPAWSNQLAASEPTYSFVRATTKESTCVLLGSAPAQYFSSAISLSIVPRSSSSNGFRSRMV